MATGREEVLVESFGAEAAVRMALMARRVSEAL